MLYLAAAVIMVPIAKRLGLGSVLGIPSGGHHHGARPCRVCQIKLVLELVELFLVLVAESNAEFVFELVAGAESLSLDLSPRS